MRWLEGLGFSVWGPLIQVHAPMRSVQNHCARGSAIGVYSTLAGMARGNSTGCVHKLWFEKPGRQFLALHTETLNPKR